MKSPRRANGGRKALAMSREDRKTLESCPHARTTCLNQHELIRKYRCDDCSDVMMCACDRSFGERFLSHQLGEGSELETRKRVPVTLGFQPAVCNACRGLPLVAAPAAEGFGRTSKIRRYYWRELFFAEHERKADWDDANPNATDEARIEAHREIDAGAAILAGPTCCCGEMERYCFWR
jgi:hypothetical protein